jgi:hypothetical protein
MHGGDVAALVVLVMTSGVTIVSVTRMYFKHLELKARERGSISSAVEQRLERMEHALDSVAVEVERISEGQRFTTRLLSDRNGVPASSARPHAPDERHDAR